MLCFLLVSDLLNPTNCDDDKDSLYKNACEQGYHISKKVKKKF